MPDRNRPSSNNWSTDESYWRENFRSRPYADQSRTFEDYRPGYKYSYDSANRIGRRDWDEAEPDLRRGWDQYEGRGESTWEQVKDSVKDAWDRITGSESRGDRR